MRLLGCDRCDEVFDASYMRTISFSAMTSLGSSWDESTNYLVCDKCAEVMEAILDSTSADVLLLPFNENLCQKCGALEANMRYCRGCVHATAAEHVHRECSRCGFWWLEAVWAGVRVVE